MISIASQMDSSLITSRRNPLVRRLRELSKRDSRKKLLLLEGTHLLEEALRTTSLPKEIVVTTNWLKENSKLLKPLHDSIKIHKVTPLVLEAALTTVSPDGVASLFPIDALPIEKEESSFIVALDRLQDPGNLGTIFRTALAAEVDAIWLALGADPLNQKVLRSSAGAVLHLPYRRFGVTENFAIEELTKKIKLAACNGFQIVASFGPNSSSSNLIVPYWEVDWMKPTILVLGNEGKGIHPLIQACCTHSVTLPHSEAVESLNVASAAVPLLMERRRAKMTSDT